MSELLRVFFNTVHPVWPILHVPSFFADLYQWDSHSFAALVVSMCMLASRYVDDPRVRRDPGTSHIRYWTNAKENPATAGLGYYGLFCRLIDHAIHSDNVIYAIQSRFFGSMFHSVDNVPHPVAQGLVADALSRSLDGGLHRSVASSVLGSSILREIRAVSSAKRFLADDSAQHGRSTPGTNRSQRSVGDRRGALFGTTTCACRSHLRRAAMARSRHWRTTQAMFPHSAN